MKILFPVAAILVLLGIVWVLGSSTTEVMYERPSPTMPPTEVPSPTPTVKETPRSSSKQVVKQLILDTAVAYGIDGERFLATAMCESGLRTDAVGDGGRSYGIFQIHLPAHPTVSKEQAFDPKFAVDWSAKNFKKNPYMWSCYRILYG